MIFILLFLNCCTTLCLCLSVYLSISLSNYLFFPTKNTSIFILALCCAYLLIPNSTCRSITSICSLPIYFFLFFCVLIFEPPYYNFHFFYHAFHSFLFSYTDFVFPLTSDILCIFKIVIY